MAISSFFIDLKERANQYYFGTGFKNHRLHGFVTKRDLLPLFFTDGDMMSGWVILEETSLVDFTKF